MAWTAIREALMVLALAPFAYYLVAIIAAGRFFRARSDAPPDFTPPVSILKPIRGLDRETLRKLCEFLPAGLSGIRNSFLRDGQRRSGNSRHRETDRRFSRALHSPSDWRAEQLGASDKVNKLCRMAGEARHEIIVITDSDVRVEPGYLRAVAAPFHDSKVGAVTCLYRGITDGGFAADLEALGNSTDFAPGVLTAWLLGDVDFLLGATMATTKKHLAEIGGFESLADYFCDDYELGNHIAARGHRVELSAFSG